MKRNWFIFGLIILLGVLLRFFRLGVDPPAYFSDEVDIAYQVRSLLATGRDYEGYFWPPQIHSFADTRTSLPIYLTLLVTLIPKMDGLLAVRVVPAVFGVLGIVFTFLLLNRIFPEKAPAVGLTGSFLLAVTPWHIHYSRAGFEVSTLYFFVVAGLYFFDRYQKGVNLAEGCLSWFFLALTPMVYSTAKLSIFFVPLVLWWWPGLREGFVRSWRGRVFVATLFVPLAIVLLSGGASKRFHDIAVFTDPTIPSQVRYDRQLVLGPNAAVGSSPSVFDVIAHNKVSYWLGAIVGNAFKAVSFDFLFVSGDSFARHSLPGLGVLDKSFAVLVTLGIGVLVAHYRKYGRVLLVLLLLVDMAVVPAALTRDGATHATRLFLLLVPLMILGAVGLRQLFLYKKVLGMAVVLAIFYETFLYEYAYYTRYRAEAGDLWHVGVKEAVELSKQYPSRAAVFSPRYENPLIFYLYYGNVSPAFFQRLFREGSFLKPVGPGLNLTGDRFDDRSVYFAGIENKMEVEPLRISNAVYFLAAKEVGDSLRKKAEAEIQLPSGEPAYWVFLTN